MLWALGRQAVTPAKATALEKTWQRKHDKANIKRDLKGHSGKTKRDPSREDKEADVSRHAPTALTEQSNLFRRSPTKSSKDESWNECGRGISQLVLGEKPRRYERESSGPLKATLKERTWSSPTLLALAKEAKNMDYMKKTWEAWKRWVGKVELLRWSAT